MPDIQWFISVSRLLRDMREKAADAREALQSGKKTVATKVNGYLEKDREQLFRLWEAAGLADSDLGNLWRHIGFGEKHDYDDILKRDIPHIEQIAEDRALEAVSKFPSVGIENLLDPIVRKHSLKHYVNGHYREAVLNAVLGISDLLRKRTGIDADGA